MSKDYVAIADDVSAGAAALRSATPDRMKGFAALGAPTYRDDALPAKLKELIAPLAAPGRRRKKAIAVAIRMSSSTA